MKKLLLAVFLSWSLMHSASAQNAQSAGDSAFSFAVYGDSRPMMYLPLKDGKPDLTKLFVEMFKPVAEHAEKEGVLLLVEPEPGLLIETCDQFLEFMQHVDSPAVGMNYDVGHAYCVGDDAAATIPKVAKYIRHFHLEDIAATRVHAHLIPGEGAIDFASALRAIKGIGYAGWVTIELYPFQKHAPEVAKRAFDRIRPLLK